MRLSGVSHSADLTVTPSTCVQRVASLLSTEINEELVLLHVESGKYYGLDEVAKDIWRRMEKPIRIEDLCSALEQDYQAAPEEIRRDVIVFVRSLLDSGMAVECCA